MPPLDPSPTDTRALELPELPLRPVRVSDLEAPPGSFSMNFGRDLDPLRRSIRDHGLIHPPLLRQAQQGFQVVCGERRIEALKSLGRQSLPARVAAGNQLSPFRALLLNLTDNLTTRGLNTVEKAMVLRRLTDHLEEREVIGRYLPLLDLPQRKATLRALLRVESELDPAGRRLLAEDRISLRAIEMLLELDRESRRALGELLQDIPFNLNQQKQLIEWLQDLARSGPGSISAILAEEGIERIRAGTLLNRPQKAKALLRELRTRRMPRLAAAERAFRRRVERLQLPASVRIEAPPGFEAPEYCLEMRFRDGADLRRQLERLSRAEGLETLGDPWEEEA